MSTIEFDSTVRSGLPVHVKAHLAPAEPDVGIFRPWAESIDLFWFGKRGQKLRSCSDKFLASVSVRDWERLQEEALVVLGEARYDI